MLTISQLIAQIESGGNPALVRYEPGWKYVTKAALAKFHAAHRPGKMNDLTANMMLSCSWGKFQMMGSNLYDLDYSGTVIAFAASEYLQQQYFDAFLRSRNINYSLEDVIKDKEKRERFALKYNGDKRVYADRMLNVFNQLQRGL